MSVALPHAGDSLRLSSAAPPRGGSVQFPVRVSSFVAKGRQGVGPSVDVSGPIPIQPSPSDSPSSTQLVEPLVPPPAAVQNGPAKVLAVRTHSPVARGPRTVSQTATPLPDGSGARPYSPVRPARQANTFMQPLATQYGQPKPLATQYGQPNMINALGGHNTQPTPLATQYGPPNMVNATGGHNTVNPLSSEIVNKLNQSQTGMQDAFHEALAAVQRCGDNPKKLASGEMQPHLAMIMTAAASALTGGQTPKASSPACGANNGDIMQLMEKMQKDFNEAQVQQSNLIAGIMSQWEARFIHLEQVTRSALHEWEQRFQFLESSVSASLETTASTTLAMNERANKFVELGEVLEKAISCVDDGSSSDSPLRARVEKIERGLENLLISIASQKDCVKPERVPERVVPAASEYPTLKEAVDGEGALNKLLESMQAEAVDCGPPGPPSDDAFEAMLRRIRATPRSDIPSSTPLAATAPVSSITIVNKVPVDGATPRSQVSHCDKLESAAIDRLEQRFLAVMNRGVHGNSAEVS